MSDTRHRQTPTTKHDQKTRHVGLAHVAQPSYLTLFLINFGEVSLKAIIRCCVRAGGLSGLPSSSGLAQRSQGDRPTGIPRFCPLPQDMVATNATAPVVSGQWQVSLRRAIASRRAVPADVKDQINLHSSFHRKREKVYPIPPPVSSGKCGFWKLRGRLAEGQGLTRDARRETRTKTSRR